jgi:hypothetical protein
LLSIDLFFSSIRTPRLINSFVEKLATIKTEYKVAIRTNISSSPTTVIRVVEEFRARLSGFKREFEEDAICKATPEGVQLMAQVTEFFGSMDLFVSTL